MADDNEKKIVIQFGNSKRGMLSPTFTSLAVSGVSGVLAANHQKDHLDSATDVVAFGLLVAFGTYLAARIGKRLFSRLGEVFGGVSGAAAGAATIGAFGVVEGVKEAAKGERTVEGVVNGVKGAIVGGIGGGLLGALILSGLGTLGGFWGGAWAGHKYSEQAAMKYIFNSKALAQPVPPSNAVVSVASSGAIPPQPSIAHPQAVEVRHLALQ